MNRGQTIEHGGITGMWDRKDGVNSNSVATTRSLSMDNVTGQGSKRKLRAEEEFYGEIESPDGKIQRLASCIGSNTEAQPLLSGMNCF